MNINYGKNINSSHIHMKNSNFHVFILGIFILIFEKTHERRVNDKML